MRVAVVCPYSLSVPGGVQAQAAGQVRALRARGHDAVLLAPGDPSDAGLPVPAVVGLGATVGVPANGSVAPLALGPASLGRAWRAVRHGRFDVVHLHEPLAPGPNYACLVGSRVPLVGTFHRAGAGAAYRWLGPLARAAAARLAVRCAVSEAAADTARGALGGHYELVGNGVELDRYAGAEPWPTTAPTVLFVARHEERKGLAVLLEAWSRRPGGDAVLWVAGEGPETDALRRRFPPGPQLVWLGAVDDAEKARRLRGADVFCAPSLRGESFGVVLLEAMAARCAVVASDLSGYASVLAGHGTLVPPGDPDALAAALAGSVAAARSGSGVAAPGALEAAAAHAGRWSMDNLAARYEALYRRVGQGREP